MTQQGIPVMQVWPTFYSKKQNKTYDLKYGTQPSKLDFSELDFANLLAAKPTSAYFM